MNELVPVVDGEVVSDLDMLADKIRAEHEACEGAAESAVFHAIRAGELLAEAKRQVKHGEWLPWLAENFGFTRQWASSCMRLARSQMESAVSISSALKELAEPRDDGDEETDTPPEPTEAERIQTELATLPDASDREAALAEATAAYGEPTAAHVREVVSWYLWPEEHRALRELLRDGETIVVNQKRHVSLIAWAEARGLLVKVDRTSPWGNPFLLDEDGDRETVIAAYRDHYLPHKPSLLGKLDSLQGKALACWCAPERCHADVLADHFEGC